MDISHKRISRRLISQNKLCRRTYRSRSRGISYHRWWYQQSLSLIRLIYADKSFPELLPSANPWTVIGSAYQTVRSKTTTCNHLISILAHQSLAVEQALDVLYGGPTRQKEASELTGKVMKWAYKHDDWIWMPKNLKVENPPATITKQ